MVNVVSKFEYIFFQLSSLKLSSVLAGLSAFKSRKFYVCLHLALDLATVNSVKFLN